MKIAQLKDGYITVLAKLKTVYRVLCLLVCEPNYLVAVEANGAFRFWTMNSTWRLDKWLPTSWQITLFDSFIYLCFLTIFLQLHYVNILITHFNLFTDM